MIILLTIILVLALFCTYLAARANYWRTHALKDAATHMETRQALAVKTGEHEHATRELQVAKKRIQELDALVFNLSHR